VNSTVWWLLAAAEVVALVVVAPRLFRSARGGRRLVAVDDDRTRLAAPTSPAELPRISVVVPARNEAARIAECLEPLRDAPGVLEVIVVDDESTDHTATIAREHGARVVAGAPLPVGWVGKIWALQQGIAAASGDVVVTLDADTRPDRQLPLSAANALLDGGSVLATVAPRFRLPSQTGTWLHAAMLTSLVYRHGAGAGRAASDAVANGQCMVFRRDDAVRGQWCNEVRGSTVEDVALVRALVRRGQSVEMFDGSSLLAVRMFEGVADTWRGWGRSIALTGSDSHPRQAFDLATTLIAVVTPPFLVAFGVTTPATIALLLIRIGVLVGTARAYERRRLGYWLSPFADLFAWIAVVRGSATKQHRWRGRTYG